MKTMLFVMLVLFLAVGCGGGGQQAETADQPVDETMAMPEAEGTAAEQMGEDSHADAGDATEQDLLNKPDPEGVYGAGVTGETPVAIAAILEDPESFLETPVRVEGTVTQVCPMRGCWIDLAAENGDSRIRVKVDDGVIVFPLSAKGRHAVVEGKVEKIELTEEQAKGWMEHEAAELGEPFDPASVTGPMTIWRIRGSGAEIEG